MIIQPRVGRLGADIIIDESGQTWVKDTSFAGVWVYPYIKIEEVRAADYDRRRNTRQRPSGRFGARGGRASNGYAGGEYDFHKGRKPDPQFDAKLADQIRIHAMLEEWFAHIREAEK